MLFLKKSAEKAQQPVSAIPEITGEQMKQVAGGGFVLSESIGHLNGFVLSESAPGTDGFILSE